MVFEKQMSRKPVDPISALWRPLVASPEILLSRHLNLGVRLKFQLLL
jgi:hypothetical protein